MNNTSISAITIGALITIAIFWIGYQTKTAQAQEDTLIIGTVGNYAPFVSMNAQGTYEGFDIDVAELLAKRMGKKLSIKDLGSMAPLFIALEQESIDAIIWALSITRSRLAKVAMIPYQGEKVSAYPLIFWKQIPQGIKSIQDMAGMTICAEPASAQDAVLRSYTSVTILPTERVDDALLNIQYGKANAALVEPAIANKFKATYPEIQILDLPLTAEQEVLGTGIAIKKTNTNLIEQITKAVAALRDEGIIAQLEEKWGIA